MAPRTAADAHAEALQQVRLHLGEVDAPARFGHGGGAPVTAAVHEFEVTMATPRMRLVRLTMNVFFRPAPAGNAVRLLVPVAGGVRRIAPLPDPEPRPEGEIRVGFAIPAELMEHSAEFELDLGDGRVVHLPRPVERADDEPARGRFSR